MTPMKPQDFIAAQVAMRLIVLLAQIVVLVGVGILFFDLQFMGRLLDLFAMGLLGGAVFLAIGFFLAGIARTEDQVVPLANVVSLPMMLLSGVFFSRANLPEPVRVVTEFFPLTYLADGMRSIVLEGSTLPAPVAPTGRPGIVEHPLGLGGGESFSMGIAGFPWPGPANPPSWTRFSSFLPPWFSSRACLACCTA